MTHQGGMVRACHATSQSKSTSLGRFSFFMHWPSYGCRWCNRRQAMMPGDVERPILSLPSHLWAEEALKGLTIHDQRNHVTLFLHWNGIGEDDRVVSRISFTHFHDGEFVAHYHCVIGLNGSSISVPMEDSPRNYYNIGILFRADQCQALIHSCYHLISGAG